MNQVTLERRETCTSSEMSDFLGGEVDKTCTGSIISILSSVKVHETCTGSIISFFHFFPRTSGQEALYSLKEIEKLKLLSLCRFRAL